MQTVQWNKFIDGQGHKPIDYSSAPLVLTAELLNGRWEHDVFESEDATEVIYFLFNLLTIFYSILQTTIIKTSNKQQKQNN